MRDSNVTPPSPDEIRAFRHRLGLSQYKLAQYLGIHREIVSCWERGVYPPRRILRPALAGVEVRVKRNGWLRKNRGKHPERAKHPKRPPAPPEDAGAI